MKMMLVLVNNSFINFDRYPLKTLQKPSCPASRSNKGVRNMWAPKLRNNNTVWMNYKYNKSRCKWGMDSICILMIYWELNSSTSSQCAQPLTHLIRYFCVAPLSKRKLSICPLTVNPPKVNRLRSVGIWLLIPLQIYTTIRPYDI